ncbi:hypothetical protein VPH35_015184 [Triticum aestivum]
MQLTNYIALYVLLFNKLAPTKTNGRIIRPTLSNGCFKFLALELISSTRTCIRKPTDSQSRKAWILSCSDNNNLGVACKKNNCSSAQSSVSLLSVNYCSSTMTHSDSCIQS